jgi:DDE superfamily endonuclease
LLCLGRHTVTGLLSTSGSQFQDWTAAYRLFSRDRVEVPSLFTGIRSAYLESLPATAPLCISIDDSLLPKTGPTIPGVAWQRDPQGPPFQTNLIRAQRVLQFSALLPLQDSSAVRGIPIDFLHAPTPPKLSKAASEEQKQEHKKLSDSLNLSQRALDQLQILRSQWGSRRPIVLSDARFTTQRFLQGLPVDVTLIGRIRKDAKLFHPPTEQPARGRRRSYGPARPTPEQIRQDEKIPWQEISIHAAGADHLCRVKLVHDVLWTPAGPGRRLRLVIIAPLAYRPRKGARLLYRDPAFLICTDPELPVEQIVQYYVWRWDIEVNFREEKSLLGVGQAQVRNPQSCDSLPAFQVAAYSLLLLAAAITGYADQLPPAKWSARQKPERMSAQRLIQNLRFEVWGRGLGISNSSGFSSASEAGPNPEKFIQALPSALFYATN